MTMLYSSQGTIRFPIAVGQTLIVQNISGVETVSGSSASREDASARFGSGYFVYGPQSSAGTIQLSTTGQLDYQLVVGDATPWNNFIPLSGSSSGVSAGGDLAAGSAAVAAALKLSRPNPGLVASLCCAPTSNSGSNTQYMARTKHFAMDSISSLQLVFANWFLTTNSGETTAGGTGTYRASIEYPAGTIAAIVTFGGSQSGVAADGTNLVSDVATLPVTIPAGAAFFVRTYCVNSNKIVYSNNAFLNDVTGSVPTSGEWWQFGTSGIVDNTQTTTNNNNQQSGIIARPAAIIGYTTRPSFALCGDSRLSNGVGYDSVGDGYGLMGEIARSLGTNFACVNLGCAGEKAQQVATPANYTRRAQLAAYCSHAIDGYGINDVLAGTAAATILGYKQTFWANLGVPVWTQTLSPVTTSTDSWATTGNQTTNTYNAQRVALNALVRKIPIGSAGYFEVADQTESARDSGLWKVTGSANGYTADGVHGNQTANLNIVASRAVAVPIFQR